MWLKRHFEISLCSVSDILDICAGTMGQSVCSVTTIGACHGLFEAKAIYKPLPVWQGWG